MNDSQWIYTDSYSPLEPDEAFVKGEKYTLIVPVRTTGYVSRFGTKYNQERDSLVSDMWGTFIPDLGDEVIFTRIVTPGDWGNDKGFAQVTTGAELIKDLGADNPDNNIVFAEAGNYTVTWDGAEITIIKN